ncbi:UNVERIFIED_CONTAM: hypothetical protein RMT77_013066 [Armadillidium vulgare]
MNSLRYFLFTVSLFLIFGYLDAITCPTGYRPFGSKCLQAFPNSEATWDEARTECENKGGYLAYMNDCTLMKIITNYLGVTVPTTNKYWIGASKSGEDEANPWVWLDGSTVQMGAPYWGSSTPGWIAEPNGEDADEDYCAALDKDDQFYLHDETCATSLNYLCEADALLAKGEPLKEKTGAQLTECPDDFILISGSCFHFHYDSRDQNTKTSYSDAQTICSDLGARLAVFDDCTLFGSVATYINEHTEVQLPSKASYWIGANDIGTDGLWYWDGPYTSLQTGSPFWGSSNGVSEPNGDENQNCAVMYRDNQYYFHDGECYKLAYPLCQLLEE